MDIPSIVDFVKGAYSSTSSTDSGSAAESLTGALHRVRQFGSAMHNSVASPRVDELAYITVASKVLAVLPGAGGLTARQLFDLTDTGDFPGFEACIDEMTSRGLLAVIGQEPKYGDRIFGLASPPAA